MQEIESGEPQELEIEAPPSLLPDLSEWGIEEIERGVCEDTPENRKAIRQNKGQFRTVFDNHGMPTPYIQAITAEMYAAAQGLSKSSLLTDPDDYNSDYLSGVPLLLAEDAKSLAPTWVLRTTKTYIRQQDEKKALGPDAELYQSRLVAVPTRCSVQKSDGTRCWGWADGSTDTLGMCRVHARRAGKYQPLGMSAMQIARNRLQSGVGDMVNTLEELAHTAESETVRLGAVKDFLDRAGIRGGIEIEQKVEVTVNEAADIVRNRLSKLKQGQQEKAKILKQINEGVPAETVDAEVVDDDE